MATLRTIRLRIKGTKNIKQITRAMEAVSAVKMRKSQSVALAARPYATASLRMLKNLEASMRKGDTGVHALLTKREGSPNAEGGRVKKTLLVVITSDKGLAGPFNANVLKKAEAFIKTRNTSLVATVGKKATEYFSRRNRKPLISWTGFGDFASVEEVEPLFEGIHEAFTSGKADEVFICYTNFLSAMKQEVVLRRLLPFSEEGLEEMVRGIVPAKGKFSEIGLESKASPSGKARPYGGYLFEPSPNEIFDEILPALLKIEIYHAILEANASEHSSRMVAMRNATDNAGELIKSYTVSLNKARQSAINKELAEITGGSEALNT